MNKPRSYILSSNTRFYFNFQKYIRPISGHSQPHTFKITIGIEGKARLLYKKWTTDKVNIHYLSTCSALGWHLNYKTSFDPDQAKQLI